MQDQPPAIDPGQIAGALLGLTGVGSALYQFLKDRGSKKLERDDRALQGAFDLMERLQEDNRELREINERHERVIENLRKRVMDLERKLIAAGIDA